MRKTCAFACECVRRRQAERTKHVKGEKRYKEKETFYLVCVCEETGRQNESFNAGGKKVRGSVYGVCVCVCYEKTNKRTLIYYASWGCTWLVCVCVCVCMCVCVTWLVCVCVCVTWPVCVCVCLCYMACVCVCYMACVCVCVCVLHGLCVCNTRFSRMRTNCAT